MQNRLLEWVNGRKAVSIGTYWGGSGVCFAHRSSNGDAVLAYVPANRELNDLAWEEAILKLETRCGVKRNRMALAVALSADDVFVRTMAIQAGLDEVQLEQVAIVEAVASVPVPPEEICLDFLKGDEANLDGIVRVAFCRRERIDAILANAEEVRIPVHVVDRDVQAIHDAVVERLQQGRLETIYPFGLLLTDITPRFVACIGPTDFEAYPIRLHQYLDESAVDTIANQLGNCWMRCKMARPKVHAEMSIIYVIGDLWGYELQAAFANNSMNVSVEKFTIERVVDVLTANDPVPDEVALIAAGMAGRVLE